MFLSSSFFSWAHIASLPLATTGFIQALPVISVGFSCHYNIPPFYGELKDHTPRKMLIVIKSMPLIAVFYLIVGYIRNQRCFVRAVVVLPCRFYIHIFPPAAENGVHLPPPAEEELADLYTALVTNSSSLWWSGDSRATTQVRGAAAQPADVPALPSPRRYRLPPFGGLLTIMRIAEGKGA